MEWYKRYTNRSNHGQMYEAGFWGGVVFDALCDSSAAYDLNGRLPKVYGDIDYLRRQLRLSEADFCGECKPSRNVTDAKNDVVTHENGFVTHENHVVTVLFQAFKRLISVGLVHEEDGFYVIDGWERKQRKSPKSDAERSRNYRENKKQKKQTEAENKTVETVTKRHVHESDANVRVTERHTRVDKSREEKKRIEKNREEILVAEATHDASVTESKQAKEVQKEEAPKKAKTEKSKSDSVYNSLKTALEASYKQIRGEEYPFHYGRDGSSLKRLIGSFTPEAIIERWERGLNAQDYLRVDHVADLFSKWPKLSAFEQQTKPKNNVYAARTVSADVWQTIKDDFS